MANSILGTRSPNGNVGVSGVVDSGELSMLTAGALSGFALTALAGMNVAAGGVAGTQDVAVAKNPAGASDLLVGNGASMNFAIGAAPGTSGQSRTDVLVVWKDTTVLATQNNGYDSVGYSVVPGAAATTGTQQPPSEATIRAAIPNGGSAFYAIVGYVTVPYGAVNAASCTLTPVLSKFTRNNIMPTQDTGWINLSVISTANAGFTVYSGWQPMYCVKNGFVTIRGAVSPNSVRVFDATQQPVSSIPVAYAPAQELVQLGQATTTNYICSRVNPQGVISLERFMSHAAGGGGYGSPATTHWLPFFFTYPVEA